jgi:predicted trehalose synthase
LEIAERIPDTFGLSIAFSGPSEKSSDKLTTLQRCSEIYSVDLVSEPAANPNGFFARKLKQFESDASESPEAEIKIEIPMNDEMKKAIEGMIQSAMMSMNEKVAKLESALAPKEDKPAMMSAQNEVVQLAANTAALAAVKEFAKSFGAPAAPIASAEAVKPIVQVQKFEDVVAAKATELKGNKSEAITFAIKNHADLYAAYRARVQGGEIVKL